MTQFEFTQRTNVEVTYNEFNAINEVYMNSDLDKDEFCKMWCKMNQKRVNAAIEAAKKEAEEQELREKAFEVYNSINGICWEDACKFADEYLTTKQKKVIALVGIELDKDAYNMAFNVWHRVPKQVSTIAYELGKYLGIAA